MSNVSIAGDESSSGSGCTSSTSCEKLLPWVEKHRPKYVNEISHQEEVVAALKTAISTRQLPHLLFYGPPGTGKTSTILAVARELFGQNFRKNGRVLELNASDERGISVVREKIKSFAQGSISASTSLPPFKLIVLDEADSMTSDAQSALRRMMENYSNITRFCLVCNYVSRIIEPVASRCAKFRFKPLDLDSMSRRLRFIADTEKISCDDKSVQALLRYSDGDLRKAINYLQSAMKLGNGMVTEKEIEDIAGVIPGNALEEFWGTLRLRSFAKLQAAITAVHEAGFPALTFFHQVNNRVIADETLSDTQKARISMLIADADSKLIDGADEYLQMMNVGSLLLREVSRVNP